MKGLGANRSEPFFVSQHRLGADTGLARYRRLCRFVAAVTCFVWHTRKLPFRMRFQTSSIAVQPTSFTEAVHSMAGLDRRGNDFHFCFQHIGRFNERASRRSSSLSIHRTPIPFLNRSGATNENAGNRRVGIWSASCRPENPWETCLPLGRSVAVISP